MPEIPDTKNNDLSELFAINYIFDLLDNQKFDNFLKDAQASRNLVFEGHMFFIKTISRGLLERLSESWSINIEDNYTFTRALNRGVPLEKIKNSSKKIVFIKNLYRQLRELWKSKDYNDLNINMQRIQRSVLNSIDSILNCNVKLSKDYENFGEETVVRRLAILYALIFLNDIRHGRPLGYFFSLSTKRISDQYLARVFFGYKTTLAFLWKQLLNEEKVETSKLLKSVINAKGWKDLDETFEIAREIVASIEKDFQLTFGFEAYFDITNPIKTDIWNKRLFVKPTEPSLSKNEELQQELFWYPIQALSGLLIFNGVATFSSLLIGAVYLDQVLRKEEKTYVVRFVHPVGENKHDYSYAILIEAFGTIADYSGWLVFYDCCGDYSGFSGSEYRFAEEIIKRYSPNLEIINLIIDKRDLSEYLRVFSANLTDTYEHSEIKIPPNGETEKNKKVLETLSTSSIISHMRRQIETLRGYMLELLAYYFLNSEKSLLKWRYRNKKLIGDDEIDIVARDKKGILYLASCTSSYDSEKVSKLDKHSSVICSKKRTLQKEFGTFESVEKILFMPEEPTIKQIEECNKFGVQSLSLKRLLRESPKFSSVRKTDIERIFIQDKASPRDLFFERLGIGRRRRK